MSTSSAVTWSSLRGEGRATAASSEADKVMLPWVCRPGRLPPLATERPEAMAFSDMPFCVAIVAGPPPAPHESLRYLMMFVAW